jgi:hypothetical protein
MKIYIVVLFFILSSIAVSVAQTDEPTTEQKQKMENFWKSFVTNLSKNNREVVKQSILFPLDIECAIGTENGIMQKEFSENYEFFFPKERVKRMKKTSVASLKWTINYSNLHKDVSKNGFLASYNYKNGFGISMQFSEVNGEFKLVYFICSTP